MTRTRRQFLKTSGFASIGLTCSAILTQTGCSSYRFVPYTSEGRSIAIRRKELDEDTFVLIKYPSLPAPIYVTRQKQGEYSALLLLCTHKQCEVRPGATILICPCHGSEYSRTGTVLNPPAEESLYSFPITNDEENIYINVI